MLWLAKGRHKPRNMSNATFQPNSMEHICFLDTPHLMSITRLHDVARAAMQAPYSNFLDWGTTPG
jgi:hypothetical protein